MVCARVVLALCSRRPAGVCVHQFYLSPQKCERATAIPPRARVGRALRACAGTGVGFFHRRDVENGSGGSLTMPLGRHAAGRWGPSGYHPPDVALCVEMGARPRGAPRPLGPGMPRPASAARPVPEGAHAACERRYITCFSPGQRAEPLQERAALWRGMFVPKMDPRPILRQTCVSCVSRVGLRGH